MSFERLVMIDSEINVPIDVTENCSIPMKKRTRNHDDPEECEGNGISPKKIKPEDVERILENHENGIENVASPEKTKLKVESDYFSLLPELAIIKIFSFLPCKDILMSVAPVCKNWRRLSLSPELWRRVCIDIRSEPKVTTEIVKMLLTRSEGIRFINLYDCTFINDSLVSKIAEQNLLRTLNLARCVNVSRTALSSIANCRSLRHLNLTQLPLTDDALEMIAESCKNLIELDISDCTDVTSAGLLPVIHNCTHMKCLILNRCEKVDDEFLIALAAKPCQIECLYIHGSRFTAKGLKYLGKMVSPSYGRISKLPMLKQLDASRISGMCDHLISMLSNLKHLGLEYLDDITIDGVSAVVHNNPNMTVFSLTRSRSIDDNVLEVISKSPCRSSMKYLYVDQCPVSETGICLILQNCTNLISVTFSDIPEETVTRLQTEYLKIRLKLKK